MDALVRIFEETHGDISEETSPQNPDTPGGISEATSGLISVGTPVGIPEALQKESLNEILD